MKKLYSIKEAGQIFTDEAKVIVEELWAQRMFIMGVKKPEHTKKDMLKKLNIKMVVFRNKVFDIASKVDWEDENAPIKPNLSEQALHQVYLAKKENPNRKTAITPILEKFVTARFVYEVKANAKKEKEELDLSK